MSFHTLLQGFGLVCALVLMIYLGGDLAGRWEAKTAYSLALSMIGMAAFFGAERQQKLARPKNGAEQ